MSAPARVRGVALLGGGTVLAALFGLLFQALLANWFGAGAETDAWFMSLSIFAFLAKFLMLTHLKSIALPVYRRLRDRSPAEARRLARSLLGWLVLAVGAATALVVGAAPWLVDLLAPGYEGAVRELTVTLVRIRTPALLFLAVTTAALVVLESEHRFGVTVAAQKIAPAAVTLLLFLAVRDRFGMTGVGWIGLAGGVAGGVVALSMVAPRLRRRGGEGASGVAPSGAGAREELRAIGGEWIRFSGSNAATFVGEWAFRVAASLLPVGLFSAVLYGRMVHDLLHGALNDAAQTVSLPRFASASSDDREAPGRESLGGQLRESLATLLAVNVPTATFVVFAASWIVALLFGRGAFLDDGMLGPAAVALQLFMLGFVVQGLNQVLFAAAFASGHAQLVNRVQIVGHLARAALLVPAVLLFSYAGLVGAQVAMNLLVLLLLLRFAPGRWRVGPARALRAAVAHPTGRGVLASTALLAAGWAAAAALLPDPLALGTVGRLGVLAAAGAAWFGGYAALAWLFRVAPVRAGVARLARHLRTPAVLLALAALVAVPAGVAGQRADPDAGAPGGALGAGLLPADHWSRAVLELLEARGTVPVGAARAGPLGVGRVRTLLEGAGSSPEASAALRRLHDEVGGGGPLPGLSVGLFGGARAAREGADGDDGLLGRVELRAGTAGGRLSGWLEAEVGDAARTPGLLSGAVGLRLGAFGLHAGRHRLQLGGGAGGGLVLSPSARLDGLLLTTERPLRLPVAGETHLTAGLFPLGRYEAVEDPWFALVRATLHPASWIRIGVSRAAQVGGRFEGGSPPFDPVTYPPDEESMDAGDVLGILVGRVTGFDNQLFGVDARASLAGAGLPLSLHAEVALEDNQRSWGDGALQLGAVLAPRGAGIPLTVRYEYTGIGDPGRWCAWCDTLPAFWYQHTRFQDGWRAGDELLGHPLGGYGLQHRLEVGLYDPGMGLRSTVGLIRQRRDRWNLLEPVRPGWSWGVGSDLRLRLSRALELRGVAELEWGDSGWTAGRASLLLGWR